MYAIKTILAHPNVAQLRIMAEMMKHQTLQVEIVGKVSDLDALYDAIIRHTPDLILLPEGYFTPCINTITDGVDIICITEDRSLVDGGNLHYAYVPVQPPELISMFQSIYAEFDGEKMEQNYWRRRQFLDSFHFPQHYCSNIDAFCMNNQIDRQHGYTPFGQKQTIFEQINMGNLQLEKRKEHHPGIGFNAERTYSPSAVQLIEDLGDVENEEEEPAAAPTPYIPDSFTPEIQQQTEEYLRMQRLQEAQNNPMPAAPLFQEDDEEDEFVMSDDEGSEDFGSLFFPQPKPDEDLPMDEPFDEEPFDEEPFDKESFVMPQQAEPPLRSTSTSGQKKKAKNYITQLVWEKKPSKLRYFMGEPLQFQDGVLKAFHTDGSYTFYNVEDSMIQPFTMAPGKQFVRIRIKKQDISLPIQVLEERLTSVFVSTMGKTQYYAGEYFDHGSFILTANYSDGHTEQVGRFKYPRKPLSLAQHAVTLKYGVEEIIVPINVISDEEIQNVILLQAPTKVAYFKGEKMDPSGGKIKITYSSGKEVVIPVTIDMISNYSTGKIGTKTVYINYEGRVFGYDVSIRFPERTAQTVSQPVQQIPQQPVQPVTPVQPVQPVQQPVIQAQPYQPAPMPVQPKPERPAWTPMQTPVQPPIQAQQPVQVQQPVQPRIQTQVPVQPRPPVQPQQPVQRPKMPEMHQQNKKHSKKNRNKNGVPARSGQMTQPMHQAAASYPVMQPMPSVQNMPGPNIPKDPEPEFFTPEPMPAEEHSAAPQAAPVREDPKEEPVYTPVAVKPPESVSEPPEQVVSKPVVENETGTGMHLEFLRKPADHYIVGEKIQKHLLLVKKVSPDGSFELVQNFEMEPDRPLNGNDHELVIWADGMELKMPIFISTKVVLAVVISSMPKKLTYIRGFKELDLEGGEISVFYSDATHDSMPITPEMVKNFDSDRVGQQIVYVEYMDKQMPLQIMINDRKESKIFVKKAPDRRDYTAGEKLDTTGLVLEMEYDNGDRELIEDFACPEVILANDQAVVKLMYHDLIFPVFVHVEQYKVLGIEMTQLPTQVDYLEHRDMLNVSGGIVSKILSNGNKEDVALETRMVSGFNNTMVGPCRLTVAVGEFTCSFNVNIVPKEPILLEVVHNPNKLIYFDQESFLPDGLALKVKYNNNTFENRTDFDFEPKTISMTTEYVTITCQGLSVQIPIQVQVRMVETISIAKMPDKLSFKEGVGQIDVSGGRILILYSNNSAETIDMYPEMIEGFDNTIPGSASVIVRYQDAKTEYTITIEPKVLIGLALTKFPEKTIYQQADIFDPAGMVVTGFYDNGQVEEVKSYYWSPMDALTMETNAVIISFMGKSIIVPITVVEHLEEPEVPEPEPVLDEPTQENGEETEEVVPEEPEPEPMPEPEPEPVPEPPREKAPKPARKPEKIPEPKKKEKPKKVPFYFSSVGLRFNDDDENSSMFF